MDVADLDSAMIAEEAGAVAVMVLDKLPYQLREQYANTVKRTAHAETIERILAQLNIPVMAKCRIGHYGEARILEALGVDMIDESEVLTVADTEAHLDKHQFTIPFVCGATDLGSALRRIEEGATMIRTKGIPGTGNIAEAVLHHKRILRQIAELSKQGEAEHRLFCEHNRLKELRTLTSAVERGRLQVVNFAAGGIVTIADACLMMAYGSDGIFVGSGIFGSGRPAERARALVDAVAGFEDTPEFWKEASELSKNLGEDMPGNPYPNYHPVDQSEQH